MEDREWVLEGGEWVPRYIEETKKAIRSVSSVDKSKLEEAKLCAFDRFMKNLRG